MDTCVVCDGNDVQREELDDAKAAKLRNGAESLQEEELSKAVCNECGHIAYLRGSYPG